MTPMSTVAVSSAQKEEKYLCLPVANKPSYKDSVRGKNAAHLTTQARMGWRSKRLWSSLTNEEVSQAFIHPLKVLICTWWNGKIGNEYGTQVQISLCPILACRLPPMVTRVGNVFVDKCHIIALKNRLNKVVCMCPTQVQVCEMLHGPPNCL